MMFVRAWTAVAFLALSVQGQGPTGHGLGYGHPGAPPVVGQHPWPQGPPVERDFAFPAGSGESGKYQLVIRNPDFVDVPRAAHAMDRFLLMQTEREDRNAQGRPHTPEHLQYEQQTISRLLSAFFHNVEVRHMYWPRPDRSDQIIIGLLPPGELPNIPPELIPVEIDYTPVAQSTGAASSGNVANNPVIPVVTEDTPGYYVFRPTSDEAEENLTTPAANSTTVSSSNEDNVQDQREGQPMRQDVANTAVICPQTDTDDERRPL